MMREAFGGRYMRYCSKRCNEAFAVHYHHLINRIIAEETVQQVQCEICEERQKEAN
jgi:hypothetical protein